MFKPGPSINMFWHVNNSHLTHAMKGPVDHFSWQPMTWLQWQQCNPQEQLQLVKVTSIDLASDSHEMRFFVKKKLVFVTRNTSLTQGEGSL